MEIALLFGTLSSVLLQVLKWLIKKFGYQFTESGIVLGSFLLALVYAVLVKEKILTPEIIAWFASIMLIAEGFYKRFVSPLINFLSRLGDQTNSAPSNDSENLG